MSTRPVRPWIWAFLNLPFGATAGFVGVMLGYILKQQGQSDAVISGLIALNLLPNTFKVLWAPIADSTMTRKRWYVISNVASSATIVMLAFVPISSGNLGIMKWLVFVNSVAITLLGMSVEGLMVHATTPEQRGRAAGWFQVGNLGGTGVGGGLGLMLAKEVSSEFALINVAVVLLACTGFLLLVPEAPRIPEDPAVSARHQPHWFARIIEVFKEVWEMASKRRGLVAIILVFLPCGAAALVNLFPLQMAKDWAVSANVVAVTGGWMSGIAAAAGCLAGGLMSDFSADRVGRAGAYMISGAILAAVAVAMALCPKTPVTYIAFTMAYQAASGVAYGCFTGFVLEVIGKGAAATKYNALASLSNIPIWYMSLVLGWASTRYGTIHALFVEAGSEIAGVLLFLVALAIVRPNKQRLPDQPQLPRANVVD